MQITVNSVGNVVKEKNYTYFDFEYTPEGKPKMKKKVMSFNKVEYDALKGAKEGDQFSIKAEKDGQFWKWTEVASGSGTSVGTPTQGVVRSDKVNRAIIRQSSLGHAVAFHAAGGEGVATVEDVLACAADFERWVNREDAAE